LSETELENERLALEETIGKVEADAILSEEKWPAILKYFSMRKMVDRIQRTISHANVRLVYEILVGIVFIGTAYLILYLIVTLAVLLSIVWTPPSSRSLPLS
jgi:hypothetical protein